MKVWPSVCPPAPGTAYATCWTPLPISASTCRFPHRSARRTVTVHNQCFRQCKCLVRRSRNYVDSLLATRFTRFPGFPETHEIPHGCLIAYDLAYYSPERDCWRRFCRRVNRTVTDSSEFQRCPSLATSLPQSVRFPRGSLSVRPSQTYFRQFAQQSPDPRRGPPTNLEMHRTLGRL